MDIHRKNSNLKTTFLGKCCKIKHTPIEHPILVSACTLIRAPMFFTVRGALLVSPFRALRMMRVVRKKIPMTSFAIKKTSCPRQRLKTLLHTNIMMMIEKGKRIRALKSELI